MAPGVHRVRRQSWRLRVGSAREAFDARLRLRSALEDELPRALERAFDRAAPGDTAMHIPRLELRLRVPNLEALTEHLAVALDEALERAPQLQLPGERQQTPIDFLKVLLGYLDTGALAWHAAQGDPTVAAAVLRSSLLENLSAVARRGPSGNANLREAMQFYFRLLALLPQKDWPQLALLSSSSSKEKASPAETAALVAALLTQVNPPETWAPEALELVRQAPHATINELIALRPPARHAAQRIAAAVLAAARLPELRSRSRQSAVSTPDVAKHPLPEAGKSTHVAPRQARQPSPESHSEAVSFPKRPDRAADQPFALMVGNAGLVLLHPFLPRLFEACLVTQDKRLKNLEAAAALLHWLATGREEVHEFELGFVKLLLGLRPEAPLAVGEGRVGEREREESEALLGSVIGHWKALGKTSADALRVAFLQRRGALREEEAGWRLQPEPESYDVLLGRLPWGLATVKLPWMTRPLYTDWPTP